MTLESLAQAMKEKAREAEDAQRESMRANLDNWQIHRREATIWRQAADMVRKEGEK